MGVLGQVFPPTSERPAGSPTPKFTGGGRVSRTLAPQGVRWRCATSTPVTPGGSPGRNPPSPRCQSAPKLRSRPFPRAVPTRWAPSGANSGPGQGPLPRLPGPGLAPWEPPGPRGQRAQPGLEPGPRPGLPGPGLPTISLGRAPHYCPSLSAVTLKVFIGVEDAPPHTPYGLPRVLISDPGSSFLNQEPHLSLLPTD